MTLVTRVLHWLVASSFPRLHYYRHIFLTSSNALNLFSHFPPHFAFALWDSEPNFSEGQTQILGGSWLSLIHLLRRGDLNVISERGTPVLGWELRVGTHIREKGDLAVTNGHVGTSLGAVGLSSSCRLSGHPSEKYQVHWEESRADRSLSCLSWNFLMFGDTEAPRAVCLTRP